MGKFWSAAETAVVRIEHPAQVLGRRGQHSQRRLPLPRRWRSDVAQMLRQIAGLVERLGSPVAPGLGHRQQHLIEAGHSVAW